MEFSGVALGAGDLQQVTRAEARRIRQATKGDVAGQLRVLLERLEKERLISAADAKNLQRLFAANLDAEAGKLSASDAYEKARKTYHAMLTGAESGPVALALASSAVGAYVVEPGSGAVALAAKSNRWAQVGAAAGAAIGARLFGEGGGALGATIGGAIGGAVDDCLAD